MAATSSQEQFEARFAACRIDVDALQAIERELQQVAAPWASKLRLRVIYTRTKLKSGGSEVSRPDWCVRFDLQAPDGRPLYRYLIDQGKVQHIEIYLKLQARTQGYTRLGDQALFVLWAAEWFRRAHRGGVRKWQDLGAKLDLSLSQAEWRDLADAGLRQWKLRPLRLHGATHRLLNLSRQGGFPLAAVEGDGSAWATRYLKRLVGELLGQRNIGEEHAFEHARSLAHEVKESWRHDDFYVVSADLARAIIDLRREAEQAGLSTGLPPSVWLDQQRPNWRDDLPLTIDSDAGRTLIDGLMRAEAVRGGSGSVGATRLLRASRGIWHPWLRLDLNGLLHVEDGDRLSKAWSHLRLFASGELARHLPDELAIVEPVETGAWIASPRRTATEARVPLDVPVTAELRGGGERVGAAFTLKHGPAVRAPLLVCRAVGDLPAEGGTEWLELLGTSSGTYRADPLFVAVPTDWRVQGDDADQLTCVDIGQTSDGRRIWRVSGSVRVVSPEGDMYRLLSGQDSEARDTLSLTAPLARGVVSCDGRPVHLGAPTAEVRERGHARAARPGELWWRPAGERNWRPGRNGFSDALGPCDLAWRTASGLVHDRHAVVILPQAFAVRVSTSSGRVDIAVTGWPETVTVQPGNHLQGATWRVEGAAAQGAAVTIVLQAPGLPSVRLEQRLQQAAHLRDWDAGRLPSRSRIALADLQRYVAWGCGRGRLMAQLLDRDNRRVEAAEMRWIFEDELPLNVVRDDLTSLLRPLGELDACVELSFGGTDTCWYVQEFASDPSVPAGEAAHLFGRALHDPTVERDFGVFDARRPTPLALSAVDGAWLTYLRRGERVLTRPSPANGEKLSALPEGPLAAAMAIVERPARLLALAASCDAAERNEDAGRDILRTIATLAAGLRGLPPVTFDVLALLRTRKLLAVRLLFAAMEDDLPALLALETGLPFAWCLIPRRFWDEAARLEFEALAAVLSNHVANAVELAAQAVACRRTRIAMHAPLTGPLLNLPASKLTLAEAWQGFLHSEHDRTDSFGSDLFRRSLGAKLPRLGFDEAYWRALDAPCAAALAARGEVELDPAQVRGVKDTARRFPRYFQDAFAAMLRRPANA